MGLGGEFFVFGSETKHLLLEALVLCLVGEPPNFLGAFPPMLGIVPKGHDTLRTRIVLVVSRRGPTVIT